MQIRLNDLIFGESGGYKLLAPLSGLEKPPIRMSYNNYSGRDGGYVSSQFYSPREIVVNGVYIAKTCDDAQELRSELTKALKIRQSLPFFVTMDNGNSYYTDTYLRDVKMDYIDSLSGRYQITLISPDPFLYDAGDGIDPETGYSYGYIYKVTSGGYLTPYIFPVVWAPSTIPSSVTNTGTVSVPPIITLDGQVTHPTILNDTTGEYFSLNIVTSPGDKIVIDMKNKEVTLNGGSIAYTKTADSTWWNLVPGQNWMTLATEDGGDVNMAEIKWRNAVEGA